MALSKDKIKSTYPLPAYNYRVTVMDGKNPLVISFTEVMGLGIEYQEVVYKHGFSFLTGTNIIPGMRQPLRLTLKKGLVKSNDFLQSWLTKTYAAPFSSSAKRDLTIDLCDEKGLPVIRWTVIGALPVKLEAPTFAANSNEVAIASMELVARDLAVDYQPAPLVG
jgi:phage tail-like protein